MKKTQLSRSKSTNRSTSSFHPLLPHESSIQYINFLENSSQKKSNTNNSPSKTLSSDANIGIYIRIRPFLRNEANSYKNDTFIQVPSNTSVQIYNPEHQNSHKFDFHEVFTEECTQNELFLRTCAPLIDNVLKGFNAAMFVYGQTGTGKTYTMGLLNKINEKSEGLVPSALRYLFRHFENSNRNQWEVSMSFYQIYLDEIQDLLNPHEGRNLNIREENNEPYIEDLTVVTLENLWQAFELLNAGLTYRSMQATKLNETSSRSHVILTLNVLQRNSYSNEMTLSKANFIDLAGSERVSKASNKPDRRFEETKFINSSLSTLGTIIASLNQKGKTLNSHVAYRNSKLTRVLQNSLDGDGKVFLIATISPLKDHVNESISTCVFASRCKELKVRPSLQSIGMEHLTDDIPRLVEYYEGLLETQKNNIRQLEQELKSLRCSQNNEILNQGLEDINQYLSKLLISLRTFLFNEMLEIQGIRGREKGFFEGYDELEIKYPSVNPGVFSGNIIDMNNLPSSASDDLESFLGFIQNISKEIVDGIAEISRGSKSFEALKKDFLREKPKKELKERQDVEYLYRIIAYLTKMACFDKEGYASLEKETEGREKLRKYEGNIEMFLNRINGKDAQLNLEYFKKVEGFMKLHDPLNLETMSESTDPLMKTLSTLRKYSNNSFHDNKQFENDNETQIQKNSILQSKNVQNKINYDHNLNNSKFEQNNDKLELNTNDKFEKINYNNGKMELNNINKFGQNNVKFEINNDQKIEINNNNKFEPNTKKTETNNVDKTLKSIIESKTSFSQNHDNYNNKSQTVENIIIENPHIHNDGKTNIQEKEGIRSLESKKSLESNISHRSLKDLTISKKQQRLLLEKEAKQTETVFHPETINNEKTNKVNFISDVLPKEQKSAYIKMFSQDVEHSANPETKVKSLFSNKTVENGEAMHSLNTEEEKTENKPFEKKEPKIMNKEQEIKDGNGTYLKTSNSKEMKESFAKTIDVKDTNLNFLKQTIKSELRDSNKPTFESRASKILGNEKIPNEVRGSKIIETTEKNYQKNIKNGNEIRGSKIIQEKYDEKNVAEFGKQSQKIPNEPKILISQQKIEGEPKKSLTENKLKPNLKPLLDKKLISEESKNDEYYLNYLDNEL